MTPACDLPPGRNRFGTRRAVLGVAVAAVGGTALAALYRQRAMAAQRNEERALDDVCIVAVPTPYDPATVRAIHAPRAIPTDARCPVCGMYPARMPEWAAQLILANGDAFFFDSPLNLFIFLRKRGLTPALSPAAVPAAYVRDADTGDWIGATEATYVAGSKALGPMRSGNYPPFRTPAQASAFAARRGGKVVSPHEVAHAIASRTGAAAVHAH